MINKKVQDAFNAQIGEELESSYLYLAMVAYFESEGLGGMAHYMRAQATEELIHALRFFDHIGTRGGRAELPGLKKPQASWSSPLEAFKAAYAHEQYITSKIHALVDLASAEKDHPAVAMLQWFVNEQVEEEESALKVVDTLSRIGDSGQALFMLDRELGTRPMPVTLPAPTAD
ncbi:MAG: ferritin [Candidatus Eisenbacteria bacterium]|nr:ferritin [Candidatus Eisenbacteria bacterium]